MTVLIVEDNASVRRLLRRAISRVASQVWECEDGADALAAYMDNSPDVVLMDVRMPRLDGLKATRQIQAFDRCAKIVIVTDDDDDELRREATEAGACGYVLKQNLMNLEDFLSRLAVSGKAT